MVDIAGAGGGAKLRLVGGVDGSEAADEPFDLFVSALGYEPRCTHAFEAVAPKSSCTLVLSFLGTDSDYVDSRARYSAMEVDPVMASDEEVAALVRARLYEAAGSAVGVHIGVDVSSFSRLRTALVLEEIYEFGRRAPLVLDLYYSLPAYFPPTAPLSPLAVLEPVTPSYSGALADPELPVVALVGVGYEEQRGLGVIEFLEASDAWVFVPFGFERMFDVAVEKANDLLLDRMSDRRIDYCPSDPVTSFRAVQSLAHSLRSEYRVVMVPMGPKIFAACCLMVGLMSDGLDAVWRASSGPLEDPRPVEAAGPVVGLRFVTEASGLKH